MRLARAGTSRDSSDPWASTWAQELVLGGVGDVVAEGLGEELVGGGEVLLAVAEQHTGPGVEGGPGRLGHERGLAQTGLARDEEHLAPLARGDALGGVGHGLHLGFASDHTHGGAHGQTAGQRDGRSRCRPRRGVPTAPRRSRPGRAVPSGSVPRGSGTRDGCADRPWPAPRRRPGSARSRRWHTAGPPRRPGPRSSRRPLWLTSPPLSPTRRPTECSRLRLSRSTPCCMATAQARAAEAEAKTTMSPSPRFFTSVPPASAMAWRRIEK